MSEWLKEHAWKLSPLARADARRNPPTQFPATTSPNNDVLQHVPVSRAVFPGFQGRCDTVLTQNQFALRRIVTRVSWCAFVSLDYVGDACPARRRVDVRRCGRERTDTVFPLAHQLQNGPRIVSTSGAPALSATGAAYKGRGVSCKLLIPSLMEERWELKEGFALHCSWPSASA